MGEQEYVAGIERLNRQINELENGYGRGPFYDGAIRDRLTSLWRERDNLTDAFRLISSEKGPKT
jgi:hypothetical protein